VELHFAVQIVESLQNFSEDDLDVALLELAGLHQVQGRPAAQVLHDDPELRALEKSNTGFNFIKKLQICLFPRVEKMYKIILNNLQEKYQIKVQQEIKINLGIKIYAITMANTVS
jgi:hypothetical protein